PGQATPAARPPGTEPNSWSRTSSCQRRGRNGEGLCCKTLYVGPARIARKKCDGAAKKRDRRRRGGRCSWWPAPGGLAPGPCGPRKQPVGWPEGGLVRCRGSCRRGRSAGGRGVSPGRADVRLSVARAIMVRRLCAAGMLALGLAVVVGAAAGQGGTGKGT